MIDKKTRIFKSYQNVNILKENINRMRIKWKNKTN